MLAAREFRAPDDRLTTRVARTAKNVPSARLHHTARHLLTTCVLSTADHALAAREFSAADQRLATRVARTAKNVPSARLHHTARHLLTTRVLSTADHALAARVARAAEDVLNVRLRGTGGRARCAGVPHAPDHRLAARELRAADHRLAARVFRTGVSRRDRALCGRDAHAVERAGAVVGGRSLPGRGGRGVRLRAGAARVARPRRHSRISVHRQRSPFSSPGPMVT
ncbi:hypothetical protein ACQEU3_21400 [Spirillospora sp. CA-253888]